MAQNKSPVKLEDNVREFDKEVWRAIRHLDPDLVNRHPLLIFFGSVGSLLLFAAVALWLTG